MASHPKDVSELTDKEKQFRLERYQEELPENRAPVWTLLENYSHIPSDQIEPHLRAVRERAWKIFPYTCIGMWRFLDLYVTKLPEYPAVVDRLKKGDRLLDAGCCFGYVLRQLTADGVPASHLVGSDLRQEFLDLGYELFRDRDTFGGKFIAGDMLTQENGGDPALAPLDGTFDVIHAASFFHLFGWDDQVKLGERVVRFYRTEASPSGQPKLLFGRQVGNEAPETKEALAARGETRFHHNPATLQELWDEIGRRTGTKWKVDARLVGDAQLVRRARPNPDGSEKPRRRFVIQFAIYKVE